jgi:hypothetical protein
LALQQLFSLWRKILEFFLKIIIVTNGFAKRASQGVAMPGKVQELAEQINMQFDEFIGEMRKRKCSQPTAIKIWIGTYDDFNKFNDNDIYLSNLRKAADVLKVSISMLFSK